MPRQSNPETAIRAMERRIRDTKSRRRRVDLQNALALELSYSSPIRSLEISGKSLTEARRMKYPKGEAEALLAQASSKLQNAEYQQAITAVQRALELFKRQQDERGIADGLQLHAELMNSTGAFDTALEFALQSLDRYRNLGYARGEGVALRTIGVAHLHLRQFDRAQELLDRSIAKLESVSDRENVVHAMHHLAELAVVRDDYEHAMEILQRILKQCRVLGMRKMEGRVLNNIGGIHLQKSRYSEALQYLHEACNVARSVDDARLEAVTLFNIGAIHHRQGEDVRTIDYYMKYLRVMEDFGDNERVGRAMLYIGEVYLTVADYPNARQYFMRSLRTLQRIGSQVLAGNAMASMAKLYIGKQDYPKALEWLVKAKEVLEKAGDRHELAICERNLASLLPRLGRHREARQHLVRSLKFFHDHHWRQDESGSLGELGQLYYQNGEYPKAQRALEQAIAIAEEIGAVGQAAEAWLLMGKICIELQDPEQAVAWLEKARSFSETHSHKQLTADVYHEFVNAYELLNDASKALRYHKLYHSLENEIVVSKLSDQQTEDDTAYHAETLKHESDRYRAEAERLTRELEQQKKEQQHLALQIVRQNELLDDLRARIKGFRLRVTDRGSELLGQLLHSLERNEWTATDLTSFEKNFQLFDPQFINTLAEKYPTLSSMELKVCSLLKIRCSTKDIASILNLSSRTVETHRYNLRRKLGLKGSGNVAAFFASKF